MMSRASLVRCSCPWRVKPIFPMTHLPCLTSSWVTSTVSEIQRATGCRSRLSEEIATNRQGKAARNLNRSSAIPDGYLRFHLALSCGRSLGAIPRRRILRRAGRLVLLPCSGSPFFPRKQRPPGSARSRPGREAAERTLDGEDRSGIMRGEVKGNFATWPALRRVIPQVNRVAEAWPAPSLRARSRRLALSCLGNMGE